MSDDLLAIFKAEARGYVRQMNAGLLQLEVDSTNDPSGILQDLNRMAHSMKGAAATVGYEIVEQLSQSLEQIFIATLHDALEITVGMTDILYDSLDIIDRRLSDLPVASDTLTTVSENLGKIIADIAQQPNTLANHSTETVAIDIDTKASASDQVDELNAIFYTELEDYLAILNKGLLHIETAHEHQNSDLLREMNRIAHSMKGASQAVHNQVIARISHYLEELFQQALLSQLIISPNVADTIYDALDLISNEVHNISIEQEALSAVLTQLAIYSEGQLPSNEVLGDETIALEHLDVASRSDADERLSTQTITHLSDESLRVSINKLDRIMADASTLTTLKLQVQDRHKQLEALYLHHLKWQREWRKIRASYGRILRDLYDSQVSSPELDDILLFLNANEHYLAHSTQALGKLQQILVQDSLQIGSISDQLQENVSDLRMMPFETLVSTFQRIARDVARQVDKTVHLAVRGAEVAIDKAVLDLLKEPLMHLIRNAIDHGIEGNSERERMGKPFIGQVIIEIEQPSNEVIIRVSDDGRGFHQEQIIQRALQQGLIQPEDVPTITADEINMLVFRSGFTTSSHLTAISGRGMGMDIVKTRIEALRGHIAINSQAAMGTTVTMIVPTSLTRLRVITFKLGDELFAIAANQIERMQMIQPQQIYESDQQSFIMINDHVMQLLSLGKSLQCYPSTSNESSDRHLITLKHATGDIAFVVDDLLDEIEIILKPLGKEIQQTPFIAGAAVIGSGDILLVLNTSDIVRHVEGSTPRRLAWQASPTVAPPQRIHVLVVDDSITTRTLEKNILTAAGFEVTIAVDGVEAWQTLNASHPDVIISDIEMPNMNGLELTRLIKNDAKTRHIPTILLTSLHKPEQRQAGLEAGADAYLVKSEFDQETLIEMIRQLV